MNKKHLVRNLVIIGALLLMVFSIVGCGGGSSGDSTPPNNLVATVGTLAGNSDGAAGYIDAPGPGAAFNCPTDITVGDNGTLYITDTNNFAIRTIITGDVGTLTLTGNQFKLLSGIVFNSHDGNLYMVDISTTNNCVYKVTTNDAIYPKISFQNTNPLNVAVDNSGIVYVTTYDSTNKGAIWKIDTVGMVSKLTTDQLTQPRGIAYYNNNLYMIGGNTSIYKVDLSGNITLFVSDGKNHLNPSYVDGPAAKAMFDSPSDITSDGQGNFYVTEFSKDTIRKIDSNGNVTTIAGQVGKSGSDNGDGLTQAKFGHPAGIVYFNGKLYVADSSNNAIRVISFHQ